MEAEEKKPQPKGSGLSIFLFDTGEVQIENWIERSPKRL
jgi:hypothetical protein